MPCSAPAPVPVDTTSLTPNVTVWGVVAVAVAVAAVTLPAEPVIFLRFRYLVFAVSAACAAAGWSV